MQINSSFNTKSLNPSLQSLLDNQSNKTALDMLCIKVGIVQNFYPESLTVDVIPVNKKTTGYNSDGSAIVKDWAMLRAKVCYCNKHITQPINKGDECLLLFSDRELETWFINGNTNGVRYNRMHDETDCIAIMGIRSLPQMIQILTDCLHLFYGNSDIQIAENNININTTTLNITADTAQVGNTVQTGSITADNLVDTSAATGLIVDSNGKTLASVVNGIVKEIY